MFSEIEKYAYSKGYRIDKYGIIKNPSGNVISGTRGASPYMYFALKHNGKHRQKCYFHRLQAYQKFGDSIYDEGLLVRHLNGNSMDNSLNNIELGTYSDNIMDIPKEIRVRSALIANIANKTTVYSDETVIEIKKYYNKVKSYTLTMIKFNISSRGTLHYILNRRLTANQKFEILNSLNYYICQQ
ncbi:HNH endonuclease [Dysgonomonas sp. Marseille-P4677]|uniref:HNH endonuclease n=1 Tax=Dysgonomonas sp. Marseille-P4677 TaxID=2364790 RepID=UPI001F330648|nr:HNH endonuclease [Dysgonomonas sp. Marseille-P4677]